MPYPTLVGRVQMVVLAAVVAEEILLGVRATRLLLRHLKATMAAWHPVVTLEAEAEALDR